jgi:hypothetical protein
MNDTFAYDSQFLPGTQITVVFKENPNYGQLNKFFNDYGYGFYVPEFKTIFIDGEVFLGEDGLTMDDLRFIEAHEISHLILNHDGPRSENDELEADLGAYILLKNKNLPTDRLVDEFEYRHGIEFSEDLINKIGDKFPHTLRENSIINWELHQQLMEKKYGKRKIETEFKFKK